MTLSKRIWILMLGIFAFTTLMSFASSCTSSEELTEEVTPPDEGEGDPDGDEDGGQDDKPSIEEEPDDPAADPVLTFDYSKISAIDHPRLLMTSEDFERLRTKVTNDRFSNKNLYKIHKMVLDQADTYIAQNEVISYKLDAANKRLLEQSRLALQRIWACAYAYRLTGRAKYLEKAEEDIQTVCKFPDWNASKHFLDVGEMALGVAIGYDWLYYELSYETRVLAHRALVSFAMTPSRNAFNSSTNNWNQVCYGGLVSAAIALYEKDKAKCANIIEEAIRNNAPAMEAMYSPDGNYPEGYMYWGYGTTYEVVMLTALEKVFGSTNGLAESAGFDKTGEYMLFMAGTTGMCFDYSDCSTSELAKYGMWWFAAKQNNPSLLVNELRLFNEDLYPKAEEVRMMPMVPCLAMDLDLDNVNALIPSKKIWSGNGITPVVLVHTDWSFTDTDKYLGIKGGKASSSHGHMDAGSFVYDAYGVRWSEDLGMQSYAALENALADAGGHFWTMTQGSMRWQVYRLNNLAHSTLTVNGSDHRVNGVASIDRVIDSGNELGARLKMTDVLSDQLASAYRTVKLVNEEDLYVIDELTALSDKDATVQWRMMTGTTVNVAADGITLTGNGKTMYLTATSSDSSLAPSYTSWEAKGAQRWDMVNVNKTVVGYTITIPAGHSVTLTTKLSATK